MKQLFFFALLAANSTLLACGDAESLEEESAEEEERDAGARRDDAEEDEDDAEERSKRGETDEESVEGEEQGVERDLASGSTLEGNDLLRAAVIRIEAKGAFATPLADSVMATVTGSGFVIDESGLALTNSHVVSGATLLKVQLPSEDEERNATVVARAECSDLALLQIDGRGGERFNALEWSRAPADLGTPVLAAGYPLGGDLTLTRGIVSKASSTLHSDWASVDDVLEHDATINPGNSGGPLLTEDYELLGVNYAGSVNDQYYAIGEEETFELLDELKQGHDVFSIGLTGTAITDGDFGGIWVFGVRAGDAAEEAGIEPGDVIVRFGDLLLEPDENGELTMEDYCDILRSHGPNDAINIQVYRYWTGELLEGQIRGDRLTCVGNCDGSVGVTGELAALPATAISEEPDGEQGEGTDEGMIEDVTEPTPPEQRPDVTEEAVSPPMLRGVSHPSNSIELAVLASWEDAESYEEAYLLDELFGHRVVVAVDVDAWWDSWSEPGVEVFASVDNSLTPSQILGTAAEQLYQVCGASSEPSETSTLASQVFGDCDGATIAVVAQVTSSGTLFILYQATTQDEIDVAGEVLDSVRVTFSALPMGAPEGPAMTETPEPPASTGGGSAGGAPAYF